MKFHKLYPKNLLKKAALEKKRPDRNLLMISGVAPPPVF